MRICILIAIMLMTGLALCAVSISHDPPAVLNADSETELRLQIIEGIE